MSETNPFIGARPYGPVEDRMFFGRARATLRLSEMIDLRPLTILTSPSGIGKTSLLRAAVLPALEASGLCPVYLRPGPEDGLDACATLLDGRLATAIAEGVLLDPALEQQTLDLVVAHAPAHSTLNDVATWFRALAPADRVRSKILAPGAAALERLSVLARFLRGTLAIEAMAAYWQRLSAAIAGLIQPETPIDSLRKALKAANPDAIALLDEELRACGAKNGNDATTVLKGLEMLLQVVPRSDGDTDMSPRIVLVLDQFEQAFTLSGPQTRARTMEMLAEVASAGSAFNLVLSLRKEWYADLVHHLGPLVRQSSPLDRSSYHLEPMTRGEATEVMTDCPHTVGAHPIPEDQQEALWQALQTEAAVDAVALSIACHELFARSGDDRATLVVSDIESLLRATPIATRRSTCWARSPARRRRAASCSTLPC